MHPAFRLTQRLSQATLRGQAYPARVRGPVRVADLLADR
jgi:hypothetical protein